MRLDDHEGEAITVLSTHAPPKGRSVLEEVEAYWRGLRGDRLLPRRHDVDPARIDGALPHAFILERVAPGTARMRVAGQALSRHLGADARGMPLSAFFTAAARPRLRELLDQAFDGPAIVEVPIVLARRAFRPKVAGRLLVLPLEGHDGEASRALGALLLDGSAGRNPCQFDIADDCAVRCEPVAAPARPMVVRKVAGMAAAVAPAPRLARAERPWLRLVVSNG